MGLRAFALDALPEERWRNGGGLTRTIAMQMREGGVAVVGEPPWDWRISVATIERGGAFSVFAGVDRSSLLLGPGRIDLSAAGETTLQMQCQGEVVDYRGDPVWTATVLRDGPPLSLLNVMTRRCAAHARMKASRDHASMAGHALAVLVIDGRWRVVDTSADADPHQGSMLAPGEGAVSDVTPSTLRWRVERTSPSGLLSTIEIDRAARP